MKRLIGMIVMAVSLGRPLQLSENQINRYSQVSELDIERAKLLWKSSVNKKFKSLLDAQVLQDINATNNHSRSSSE
jgi:hypothetical protein